MRTISRQATSQATSRPAGIATYGQASRPVAQAATIATSASSSTERTRRRRRVARLVASRRAAYCASGVGEPAVGLVVTTASSARPGATTRRAIRALTGSRRARTRMLWENRSTERPRTTSS